MIEIFAAIIVLSIGIIIFFLVIGKSNNGYDILYYRIPAVIFSMWLISIAMFGPYFYVVHISGFSDISIDRFFLILLGLIILTGVYIGRINFRLNNNIEILIFIFTVICVVSMLRFGIKSINPRYASPSYIFTNGYLLPFISFIFAKYYLNNEKNIQILFNTFFFFGVYLSITAFFEFFKLNKLVFPRYITDPNILLHLDRARGPLLNSAFNGVAMTVGFICGLNILQNKYGLKKLIYIGLISLFLPAIFFTQTKSAYLGFLITMFMFFLFFKTKLPKWKTFAIPVALFLVFVIISIPKFASSDRRKGGMYQVNEIEARIVVTMRAMSMFLDHQVAGIGLAQYIPTYLMKYSGKYSGVEGTEDTYLHNHIISIMVELGLIGIVLYISIVTAIFRRIYSLIKKLPKNEFLGYNFALSILMVWCVYLNNNLFVEPTFCPFVNIAAFTFGGLSDGIYTTDEK